MASTQSSAKSTDCVIRKDARDLSGSPIFPVEIVHRILLSLSPRELLLLQTVSKQFRAVINDPIFWKALYADARLPRPPGPYSWQSSKFLQRTLVHSARLAQRWTSHPINVLSTHLVTPEDDEECKWVGGRWSIGCIGGRQLDLLDTETGFEKTLYQSDDVHLLSWAATSCNMSTRGLLLYVVLHTIHDRSGERAELLEFRIDAESGQISDDPIRFDVPMSIPEDIVIEVLSGDTPFVCIFIDPWRMRTAYALIFDTRSRIFYSFPEPISELDTDQPLSRLPYGEVMLTATHVILCYMQSASTQFIRALIVPEDGHELRVTHETTIFMQKFTQWSLLRNSVVDPITGATRLRFLHEMTTSSHQYICTDITLPANPTEDVLPISVGVHEVFGIDDPVHNASINPIESSADGSARGLCVVTSSIRKGEIRVRKFSIDATGPRCMAVVGDPSTLSMPDPNDFEPELMVSFNAMRGRICFTGSVPGDDMPIDVAVEFE